MIAVIFEVWPAAGRESGYFDLAAALREELAGIDGFLSVERFQSLAQPGKLLSLSFWRDEAAVAAWRSQAGHRAAQAQGRAGIFADYRLRVAAVRRDYGRADRAEAPADSRAALEGHEPPDRRADLAPQGETMDDDAQSLAARSLAYVRESYLTQAAFVERLGGDRDAVERLIAAGAIPDASYVVDESGLLRSAPFPGIRVAARPERFFAPAALLYAQRAVESLRRGLAPAAIAATTRAALAAEIEAEARRLLADGEPWPEPEHARPDGRPDFDALMESAWGHWVRGVYGVCVRDIDGRSLARKWIARGRIRRLTEDGATPPLDAAARRRLAQAVAMLDRVLTPFAPHERDRSSRGLWVDRIALRYGLAEATPS